MIPQRSITQIAAVTLPEELRSEDTFGVLPSRYVRKIFDAAGRVFDLRLCIRNLPKSHILSTNDIFEDIHFAGDADAAYSPRDITLEIQTPGKFDGFLLWLKALLVEGVSIDILHSKHSLLPIYLPAIEEDLYLEAGDKIIATCTTTPSENGLNPDFRIDGAVQTNGGSVPISVRSSHCAQVRGSNSLYRRLLERY
jgi:hypothetical protein